jgi:hypothetical protein
MQFGVSEDGNTPAFDAESQSKLEVLGIPAVMEENEIELSLRSELMEICLEKGNFSLRRESVDSEHIPAPSL